ncbi:MAG: hypothetical protein GXP49_18890 [Deltaproteobacteria bacterium]|nr:hypothetical protein [Deltaproteobacteria bacterium]
MSGLLEGTDVTQMSDILDRIAKIHTIQDMPASKALHYLVDLKTIIRSELDNGNLSSAKTDNLFSSIDELTLHAFDAYMSCREKIMELRINDVKRNISGLMRELHRHGFLEDPDEPSQGDGPGMCASRLSRGDDR